MKFFKNLKAAILGSIKEDLNSALGGKQALFNSKIAGALDDLIAMKTGINISNIPDKITEEAALASEARRKLIKNPDEAVDKDGVYIQPSDRSMLRFPTSNDRFIDNWIIFRTIPRVIDGKHMQGNAYESNGEHGIEMVASKANEDSKEKNKYSAVQRDCTIALYFPNNVKDTIGVDYETKDVGIGDAVLNEIFTSGGGTGIIDAIGEGFQGMKESVIAKTALQEGIAVANPKFLNFGGVQMREHTYTFALNPYNESDAKEITDIVHWFKMMSLPMSSNKNPRISILPAEWSINFKGPILGHIEHPQNCFLATVDVDYSGGKDMSFIESADADIRTQDDIDCSHPENEDLGKNHRVQHYPNGITLTLTFKEILNIDRLRYQGRVSAKAMGSEQDVMNELENFEYGRGNRAGGETTEYVEKPNAGKQGSHNKPFGSRGTGSHMD